VVLPDARGDSRTGARSWGGLLPGPCLIEPTETTILVPPGTTCQIDPLGTAVIT
jgi:hypothetical protein